MFNFEYRFTHTYEDRFSRPFSRSINLAEKNLKKLTTQTVFAIDKVNDLGKSFEKAGKKAKFEIKPDIKLPDIKKKLSIKAKEEDKNIEQNLTIKPKIEDIKEGTIYTAYKKDYSKTSLNPLEENKQNYIKNLYNAFEGLKIIPAFEIPKHGFTIPKKLASLVLKPELAFSSKFKKQFQFIQTKFHKLEELKIKPDDKKLKDIEKKGLQVEADIKPDTSQLEQVEKQGLHLNVFMAHIETGDAKEQLLSFSESLYEATKYGVQKAELGKEIAKQVKELDGLVSMSEMGNAVVSALKVGIRGSEKELAQYAKEIQKFHELTGKSYEESAQLIYKLKDKFKLPTKEISKVIDEMAVLRKNFAITEDDLTNALSSVKDEFGSLISAMDKTTKSKFTEGMLRWSAALEQMHISAKDTFDLVNKALEGDSQAWSILSQGGISFSQLQKAMQEGNIEEVAKAYEKAIISIGQQLRQASPVIRKQLMQMYGLSEEMANSFMEAASQADQLHKQTEKAFSVEIKGGEAQKQWEEATNPFTKGLQKIENEVMAFFGDKLPDGIFDALSNVDNLVLLAIAGKLGVFDKLKGIGLGIGEKLLSGIKGGIQKGKITPPTIKPHIEPPKVPSFSMKQNLEIPSVAKEIPQTSKFAKALGALGKVGKYAGKIGVVGSVLAGVMEIGSALLDKKEENKTERVSKAIGGIGGSVAGSAIGAAIGTAILPGIGTAIGGFLGSIAGGFLGEKAGSEVGQVISHKDSSPTQAKPTQSYEQPKSYHQRILEKPKPKTIGEKLEEAKKDEELLVLYDMNEYLYNISNNTAILPQLNQLMSQYIELIKMLAKQQNKDFDDVIFKGFKR